MTKIIHLFRLRGRCPYGACIVSSIFVLAPTLLILFVVIGVIGCGPSPKTQQSDKDTSGSNSIARLVRIITLPQRADDSETPEILGRLAYDNLTERLFISASDRGSVEVVDLATGKCVKQITGLARPDGITVIEPSVVLGLNNEVTRKIPGSLIVACDGERAVHVYSLVDLNQRGTFVLPGNPVDVRMVKIASRASRTLPKGEHWLWFV